MATSNNIGSNKRTTTTTHLVLASFLVFIMLKQKCQVDAFNRRNLNHGAAAFIVQSSPLSASTTKRSIIHERLNGRQRVSLSMTFLDSTFSLIATSLQDQSTHQLLEATTTATTQQIDETAAAPIIIEQLSPTTTLIVFIIGIIPFIWATIEFWRRIAVGASFGTTADSVVIPSPFDNDTSSKENSEGNDKLITIGEDNNPMSSRGRQTLDRGALTVAYVLFGVAAFTVGIAVASVVMGPKPDMIPL